MQRRRLGQTDIHVSVLGLGTVKWGRNQGVHYPHAFTLPDETELAILLQKAKDHGINLLDTAPAYGESEARLGRLLRGARHDWVLSTKAGELFHHGQSYFDFSADGIRQSIECSLKRLQTDYLDMVLVHSNGEDVAIIEEQNVFETLNALKSAGKVRAIGMSTKTIAGGLLTVALADVVMLTCYPGYEDEVPVIHEAAQLQKGVLIKKALASGHLERLHKTHPVQGSLQFNLSFPAVASVIIGTIQPAHLEENIRFLTR